MYKLYNYKDEYRKYTYNGIDFLHLATIVISNTKYVAYKVLFDGQVYVEQLISTKLSDKILAEDTLMQVKDEKLWQMLVKILQKESII